MFVHIQGISENHGDSPDQQHITLNQLMMMI